MNIQHNPYTALLSFGLILIIVGSACAVNLQGTAKEPIIVTATPPGAVGGPMVITATPLATATLPPVTLPDLPPQDALTRAEQALHNGNYVLAVGQYQTVLNQGAGDEALRSGAWYGLGQAALREGLFSQAAEAFSQFISQYPLDPRMPQAHFQRGDAYLGVGNWSAAINDFVTYLEMRPGILDSYAYERIGDAYLNLDNPQAAFDNYVAAANSSRTVTPMVAMRERIAAAYLNQGLYNDAIAQYNAILSEARNSGYLAGIELQAAQVEIDAGKTNDGYNRLKRLITTYPETSAAYQGMIILLNNNYTVDNKLRAQISFANEDYGDAITALNNYSAEVPAMPTDALLMLGQAYRGLENWDAAMVTFQTILDQYPTDPAYGQAWLEQGRTYFLRGDFISAVSHYSAVATNYPTLPEAPEALWRAGYIYATQLDDVDRALGTFDILNQTYPGNRWAVDGLQIAASLALRENKLEAAQIFYTDLANSASNGEEKAKAFFWLARLYEQQGNTGLAQQTFLGAQQADPGGYYSLRAADILAGREPFTPPAAYQFEFDEGAALAEAEQWLRATFSIQQEGLLYPLNDTVLNDPRFIRGSELWEVGAFDDARAEFEELREDNNDNPLATYQLAHHFSEIGAYRLSIEAAATLVTHSGSSTFDVPSYIARLRYPVYYNDLVLTHAEEYGLDPLLVFSIIRQESLFQGFATSFAYAQGLMQIIPDTGYWVATQLEWPNYQNSDLYRPFVNVKFGTYYLAWVLTVVDNTVYAALAGYNGGPGNAQSWLDISGQDIDRFVQAITFDETESYVTRIYEQYNIYRYLYGVDSGESS
ncbi:MAG: tetratricopeptide repeat protein [Chloroflexi bacterium]|nr:tetratricopeptide repeat protein [Chloroflexota bacterium]